MGVAVESLSQEDLRRAHITVGVVANEVEPDSATDRAWLRSSVEAPHDLSFESPK